MRCWCLAGVSFPFEALLCNLLDSNVGSLSKSLMGISERKSAANLVPGALQEGIHSKPVAKIAAAHVCIYDCM